MKCPKCYDRFTTDRDKPIASGTHQLDWNFTSVRQRSVFAPPTLDFSQGGQMNIKQEGNLVSQGFRVAAVIFTACGCALAQYGAGTGGGGATGGTYTPGSRSYGHGAAIAGIAGGVAGAGLLLYALHHRHAAVVGCVSSDGKTLKAQNSKHSY